jgi:excisionase family DNA binding protein
MGNNTISYIDFRVFERDYSLSRRTFFKLIADGKLTAYKPSSRKTLVRRAKVERLLEASKAENSVDRVVGAVVAEVLGL